MGNICEGTGLVLYSAGLLVNVMPYHMPASPIVSSFWTGTYQMRHAGSRHRPVHVPRPIHYYLGGYGTAAGRYIKAVGVPLPVFRTERNRGSVNMHTSRDGEHSLLIPSLRMDWYQTANFPSSEANQLSVASY